MVQPRWSGGTMIPGSNSVGNEQIKSSDRIDCDKLQQLFSKGTNFGHAIGDTPTDEERIVHVATGAGLIRGFHALLNDTGTNTDVDFDLKVNGSTVLSAVVTITHGDADRAVVDGTISSATLAADDVVSIECDQTTTTGAQGPFAWVVIEEDNAPT